jgi:predicted ATPase
MPLSKEVRLLENKWNSGQGWPKRLESIRISGLRGWTGQQIPFDFPIVAIVGENGAGKSSVLQAAASIYQNHVKTGLHYASDFFPDTIWEKLKNAEIQGMIREGLQNPSEQTSLRKLTERWRGYEHRKIRPVVYIDLRRSQPISARTGYIKLAKPQLQEGEATSFDAETLKRYSDIMGWEYDAAKMSSTTIDAARKIPVVTREGGVPYSGFHQGAGELVMVELVEREIPKYALVLIDEIETSLHPRVQRRLVRELAEMARALELQIILSTHSPFVLEELPARARVYIMTGSMGKQIVTGVSPEFAMTKMDEDQHPEIDVYVEDNRSAGMLREIIVKADHDLIPRVQLIPFGAANVGLALGLMASQNRFPRPTSVFLDGDQEPSIGCNLLPGGDAPEIVVFSELKKCNWQGLGARVGRPESSVIDACNQAMTRGDHKEWVQAAADRLALGTDLLWQTMCAEWAKVGLTDTQARQIADLIGIALTSSPIRFTPPNSSSPLSDGFALTGS